MTPNVRSTHFIILHVAFSSRDGEKTRNLSIKMLALCVRTAIATPTPTAMISAFGSSSSRALTQCIVKAGHNTFEQKCRSRHILSIFFLFVFFIPFGSLFVHNTFRSFCRTAVAVSSVLLKMLRATTANVVGS